MLNRRQWLSWSRIARLRRGFFIYILLYLFNVLLTFQPPIFDRICLGQGLVISSRYNCVILNIFFLLFHAVDKKLLHFAICLNFKFWAIRIITIITDISNRLLFLSRQNKLKLACFSSSNNVFLIT
jgi:hypothetical protein